MISEELRVRLEQLNRGAVVRPAATIATRPPDLQSLVPGEVVTDHQGGQFYRIRRALGEMQAAELSALARDHVPASDPDSSGKNRDLLKFVLAFPARAIFLDLETCGFSGAPLFLIGLLRQIDSGLVVEQLLARNYAEEPAVLRYLWHTLTQCDVLITFNGKSFDWPFVMDRSVAHRLAPPRSRFHGSSDVESNLELDSTVEPRHRIPPTHCDVLHLARRYWKAKHGLPNCRLQTLENVLCGRRRHGDIPGYMIGDVYHRFVRSGDARHVEQVLHHNAVDLITLAQLALLLVRELEANRLAESLYTLTESTTFGGPEVIGGICGNS